MIRKDWFTVPVDLIDACYGFPVALADQLYLRSRFEEQLYQFFFVKWLTCTPKKPYKEPVLSALYKAK